MNLIDEPWIEAIHKDGRRKPIRVTEITDPSLIDIHAPRADFRGALYQFLIGLLQTAFAPSGNREWRQYWREPPAAEALEEAFAPFRPAFELIAPEGEPAFMQDLTLEEGEEREIAALLIEAPGGNTIKNNQDHFIKRGGIDALSLPAAAMALFTMQINAPSGGQGHRVSLRGGGPLTTLVMPPEEDGRDTLWRRLWMNVLTREEVGRLPGNHELQTQAAIFPWMGPTRTSEKKGQETYPEHAHPLQAYWSMPRRIRLAAFEEAGQCDLTGAQAQPLVREFVTRNYGVNYAGSWIHPLTPYAIEPDKEPLSIKGQPGGLGYRHWPGLVAIGKKGKATLEPARVVQVYNDRFDLIDDADFEPRLWVFGYDMDNMKARCWYEAEMPLFNLGQEQREDLARQAQQMIEVANDALKNLKGALKRAWFKRPADIKGDLSFIDTNFWSSTEPGFYRGLHQIANHIDDIDAIDAQLRQWRSLLKDAALELFDRYALSGLNEDGDLERVVKARDGKGGLVHSLNASKAMKALAA